MTVEGSEANTEPQITNEVESVPAFKNVRLSPEEQDEVLISLAQFLLENYLAEFAEQTLQNIDDKTSFKYMGCLARVRILQGKLGEELPILQGMLEADNTWLEGYVESGHSLFKQGQFENALEMYMKAIRISNLTDQKISD